MYCAYVVNNLLQCLYPQPPPPPPFNPFCCFLPQQFSIKAVWIQGHTVSKHKL